VIPAAIDALQENCKANWFSVTKDLAFATQQAQAVFGSEKRRDSTIACATLVAKKYSELIAYLPEAGLGACGLLYLGAWLNDRQKFKQAMKLMEARTANAAAPAKTEEAKP
jgi:hypothetical protein